MEKRIAVGALLVLVLVSISLMTRDAAASAPGDCVPTEAWTETVNHPAVTHDEQVLVTPAQPGQHYSLKGNSGIEEDEVPVFPADYWQANTDQEPHENNPNITWLDNGLHYASHGSNGKRDWFYFSAPTEAVYDTVTITDVAAWTETVDHPAVLCPAEETTSPVPSEQPVPEAPTPPVTQQETEETPAEPSDDPVVTTHTSHQPTKTVKTHTHQSGRVTREVIRYPADIKEEGL